MGAGAPCGAPRPETQNLKGTDMKNSEPATGSDAERESPELPDDGAMVDEHGRAPGAPSRTGTGSSAPPADTERVEKASEGPRP